MEESSILVPKIDVTPAEPTPEVREDQLEEKAKEMMNPPKVKKTWVKVVLAVVAFLVAITIYNAVSGFIIYRSALKLIENGKVLAETAKSQDLGKIKTEIGKTKKSFNSFSNTYKLVAWEKFMPWLGPYISDGSHAIAAGRAGLDAGEELLTIVEPYADLLGFTVDGTTKVLAATSGAETAKDRIDFIAKTIPDLIPKIDTISGKVSIIEKRN